MPMNFKVVAIIEVLSLSDRKMTKLFLIRLIKLCLSILLVNWAHLISTGVVSRTILPNIGWNRIILYEILINKKVATAWIITRY